MASKNFSTTVCTPHPFGFSCLVFGAFCLAISLEFFVRDHQYLFAQASADGWLSWTKRDRGFTVSKKSFFDRFPRFARQPDCEDDKT
jgi:hypothetical protein